MLTWPILLAMPVIGDSDDGKYEDEDGDFDYHILEGENLRVTTASPLLGRILSLKALPTHGWNVDDGTTAQHEGWGANRREVKPGVGWAYFKLLDIWIDRAQFTMINYTPLVVSTWSGDR